MSDFEHKANTGSLWQENNVSVVKKGKIKVKGKTEQTIYAAILRYQSPNGEDKYELVRSCGLLHINTPEKKFSEKTPDIGGRITIDGEVFKFGGYDKMTESGMEYLWVNLREVEEDNKSAF